MGLKRHGYWDTENANLHHKMSVPFATEVHTPACFEKDLGVKHFRFNGFMELSYLHPNHFEPDPSVLTEIELDASKPLTVIRFVSWGAVHDIGHTGIQIEDKINLVKRLSEVSNVCITSESELPEELKPFALRIDKTKMHSLLYYADLFVGESATMASESAMLGTPAVYIDNEGRGYTNYLESNYGIVFNFTESKEDIIRASNKSTDLLKLRNSFNVIREDILRCSIDTSDYIYNSVLNL